MANPDWCEHKKTCRFIDCWTYANGFCCCGFVKKNRENFPEEDVICMCETSSDLTSGENSCNFNVMAINEALEMINLLSETIVCYNRWSKNKDGSS